MALISVTALGCRVDKSSFPIDGDRKAAVLGLQLSPKQKKAQTTGIRRVNAGDNEVDAQTRVQQVDQKEATADTPKWKKLLGRFGQPKRIPLPRTDLLSDETWADPNSGPESALQGF